MTGAVAEATFDIGALAEGDELPPLDLPAIDRVQLALFAGASGDHNPIHLDDERARAGGLPGAIAHGMLNMAFLGRLLTQRFPQRTILGMGGRFAALAFPGDSITCRARVKTVDREAGRLGLDIVAENQDGRAIITGWATIALPARA